MLVIIIVCFFTHQLIIEIYFLMSKISHNSKYLILLEDKDININIDNTDHANM